MYWCVVLWEVQRQIVHHTSAMDGDETQQFGSGLTSYDPTAPHQNKSKPLRSMLVGFGDMRHLVISFKLNHKSECSFGGTECLDQALEVMLFRAVQLMFCKHFWLIAVLPLKLCLPTMTHMRCVSVGPGREDFFWHTCVSDV